MNNILDKNDYVTFDTAKLLKEAGYPQDNLTSWYSAKKDFLCKQDGYMPIMGQDLAAPHLWDAMKWLREEKKLFLEVTLWADKFGIGLFSPDCPTDNMLPWSVSSTRFPTYEEACAAGIAAACKRLINEYYD